MRISLSTASVARSSSPMARESPPASSPSPSPLERLSATRTAARRGTAHSLSR